MLCLHDESSSALSLIRQLAFRSEEFIWERGAPCPKAFTLSAEERGGKQGDDEDDDDGGGSDKN